MNSSKINLRAFLLYFLKKNFLNFTCMVFAITIYSICHACLPYFIGSLVDEVSASSLDMVFFPSSMILGLWLVMEIATRSLGILYVKTLPLYRAQIREMVYNQIKTYSQDFFNNNFAGSISSKIIDLSKSAEKIMEILVISFVGPIVYFVIYSFILYSVGKYFLIIFIFLVLMYITITLKMYRSVNHAVIEFSRSSSLINGYLVDYLSNIFTVKIYNRFEYEKKFFDQKQSDETNNYRKFLSVSERMNFLKSGASFIFICLISLSALWMISRGTLSPGNLSLLFIVSLSITSLSWRTNQEIVKLFLEIGTVKAILDFLKKERTTYKEVLRYFPFSVKNGEISFQNVFFQYLADKPVFKGLTLTISPGQKIGIMGPSGAGKSTFFKLILQFVLPQKGHILIDQQNISLVSLSSLREQITYIPQDTSLFHRSILDNIVYGCPNTSQDAIIKAAKSARCHDFIMNLPDGYYSIVGERGVKLSGGQRQCIAIARAILKNSSIWLIDEATSALDVENEFYLHETMNTILADKTILIIAHRISTLLHMERLLIFDQGKILEDGFKEEIIQKMSFRKNFLMDEDSVCLGKTLIIYRL